MMKAFLFLSLFLLSIGSVAAQSIPDPAQRILQQLDLDIAAARKRAVVQLESAKQFEMRRGNLDGATALQNKIVEIGGAPAAPVGAATVQTKPVVKQIQIKASTKLGGEIGAVHAGQSIAIHYVEGRWAMSGGANSDPKSWLNPDEKVFPGNMLGLYAIVDGEAKLLAEVPEGTKRKAFRHHFDKDYTQVILRIRDNDPVDNPGAVIYEITLGQ